MSEKEIQITYNTSLAPLEDLLKGVKRPGSFFSSGAWETPMPALNVEGVGRVSFPVPPAQAREIVITAERAPYGRGDQTLVDESVRKVWQIAPQKISFGGKGWERALGELTAKAAADLGCDPANVAAEFYKMLVYDKGGFFAAHRDTEKSPGMFGTLVVSLPSEHEGGDLLIRHAGREAAADLRGDEPGEVRYAAFYADCEHEVRPVTKGYRVCLVYNLVFKTKARPPKTPDHRPAVESTAKILEEWTASPGGPAKVVYLLDHHYTQATLSFGELKNADAARASVLREAAARAGCALHLGIVHIEESGWAEYTGDYHSYRGRRYRDDDDEEYEGDDDPSDYEVGEVCDGRYYIDQWRDAGDNPVDFGEIPLEDGEVLPAGALDEEEPDENHFSEATGNEGASFERTYLRAALVLWPEDRFDEVCASGGIDAAIARLGQLVSMANCGGGPEKQAAGKRVHNFAAVIQQDWPRYEDHAGRLTALLGHLARFGDANLIEAVAFNPLADHYDVRQNGALLACARVLGPQRCRDFFSALFDAVAPARPGGCMDLWRLLAAEFSSHSGELETLLDVLIRMLKARRAPERQTRRAFSLPFEEEEEKPDTGPMPGNEAPSPESLAGFLAALATALGEEKCRAFLEALAANPDFFVPGSLLLPCLEHMEKKKTAVPPLVISHLWEQCALFWLDRSSTPPPEPKDWRQSADIPGSAKNPLLRELELFARDPAAREHGFRVRKDLRAELHRAIEHAKLDMTHVTERGGSPQTLVCTKTRATYERACRQYRADCADMKRLLALAVARTKAATSTATSLRKALGDES